MTCRAPDRLSQARHLLVIDDDTAFREALSELLRESGYAVDTADHAAVAVDFLETQVFDAVVSDLVMPGNGHYVVDYVRSHQPETPVIVITSYDTPPQHNGEEPVLWLRKPVHIDEVEQALAYAFELRNHRS